MNIVLYKYNFNIKFSIAIFRYNISSKINIFLGNNSFHLSLMQLYALYAIICSIF